MPQTPCGTKKAEGQSKADEAGSTEKAKMPTPMRTPQRGGKGRGRWHRKAQVLSETAEGLSAGLGRPGATAGGLASAQLGETGVLVFAMVRFDWCSCFFG